MPCCSRSLSHGWNVRLTLSSPPPRSAPPLLLPAAALCTQAAMRVFQLAFMMAIGRAASQASTDGGGAGGGQTTSPSQPSQPSESFSCGNSTCSSRANEYCLHDSNYHCVLLVRCAPAGCVVVLGRRRYFGQALPLHQLEADPSNRSPPPPTPRPHIPVRPMTTLYFADSYGFGR